MSNERIVVGTDFSEQSDVAIEQALNVARHTGADLVVVHCMPLTRTQLAAADRSFGRPELFRELTRVGLERVHDNLAEITTRIGHSNVRVSELVTDAPEADGLCNTAAEMGARLIVVGSHGRGAVSRLLVGSVSERVARGWEGGTLIARNSAGKGGFKRIAVPADFTDRTRHSLELAAKLIARGGTIDVVHTTHIPPSLVQHWDEGGMSVTTLMSEMSADAAAQSEELIREFTSDNYEIVHHELKGPPKVVLPEYIDNSEAELAIIGSHGRKGFKRWLLGSVAEAIVRHIAPSVLVIH